MQPGSWGGSTVRHVSRTAGLMKTGPWREEPISPYFLTLTWLVVTEPSPMRMPIDTVIVSTANEMNENSTSRGCTWGEEGGGGGAERKVY